MLAHHRGGAGEPLVLLHGIGSQWQMWRPVLGRLEAEREVLALDLPGFGGSPELPAGTPPTPEALADAVEAALDEAGFQTAHVAGNSLGGWIALELAKRGRARSACALSPAGFWNRREHAYATSSLRVSQASAVLLAPRAERLLAGGAVRRVALWQLAARADRMTAAEAAGSIANLAGSPGWRTTLDAMAERHFTGAADVRGPVTVAWGERDRLLLPRQAERARRALPRARHLWLTGCGHVPTWDDPGQVARVILTSA